MSERAEEGEPRAEQRARAPPRHQQLRTEGASAMAAIGERAASLPSPEVMLGQAWNCWADAVKLHATDGMEPEESYKECGRNREAMRLCRDDMPIFGQCPAQDDFFLVMCSHCSQVVKPQAFQAHYERRHSSINKPASSYQSSAMLPGVPSRARTGGAGGVGPASAMPVGSSSSTGGSNSTHTAKEKLPHRKPHFPPKVLHDDILTPAVKVEKIHVKMDYGFSKPGHVPTPSSSSSSCVTVSSSPSKQGLNSQSVPKAHQPSPGHIPNGKSHLSPLSKKQDSSTNASSKRPTRKVLEREFNPDVHCGVMDIGARKPCTRSLTCKTHSLSQRRAVPGRRKRFDVLLAEHKNRTREKELQQHRTEPTPQPLREPHPPPHHGNPTVAATDTAKLFPLSKAKPHNPVLPRGLSSLGDNAMTPDLTLHPHSAPTPDGAACPSSDEGENEGEREEIMDKLDCHYSGYHPRPAAFCNFGSRLFGRSCYSFDRRWDRVRYALVAMTDKHVNSLMWKKVPLALENSSSSAVTSSHRSSTNSLSSSSGFLSPSPPPPYSQSHDSKPTLPYGTTLNARVTSQRAGEQLTYSGIGSSRQVSSSSPQMPSAHSSSLPSTPGSNKSVKSRSGPKHFWVKEPPLAALASSSANNSSSSDTGVVSVSSSAISLGSTKKRKNSSLLKYGVESSLSSSSSSFKKNCTVNSGTSGSSFHSSLTSTASSAAFSPPPSSSYSHGAGMNCPSGRASSMSARQDAAEPIKRMSVMMNSSDSTLSLGPFVNHPDCRTDTKRRKSSQATSSLTGTATCTAPAVGGGGAQGPGRPKMAKSPAINNIHGKHSRPMPGTPGLPNNSLIHQPKARP
ncbi:ataxin-7 isoform X2 [Silurus meridionalis]|uniref:ataxin-7 isoform X2 n=1 Tax=Silurus meridionalis TaxID=175797 RepID=UPI001EEAA3F0|nr:ataxin-7 isoform X2 [Silurus meridionalis]